MQIIHSLATADLFDCVQSVTIQSIACATLVNLGAQLALTNHPGQAVVLLSSSLGVGFFIFRGFKRVRRIDKFEKGIRGES